ncbi:MAG: HD family phosphohydrolase [bacterium]
MRIPLTNVKTVSKENINYINSILRQIKFHWWLIGFLFIIIMVWLVFPVDERHKFIDPDDYKLGEESHNDVFASVSFDYHQIINTEEEKKKLLSEVLPVFDLDFRGLTKVKEQFNIVRQVRADNSLTNNEKLSKMQYLFYIGPSDKVGLILLKASDEEIDIMQKKVEEVLTSVLLNGIIADGDYGNFFEELSKIDYLKPKLDRIRENLKKQNNMEPTDSQVAEKMRISLIDNRSESTIEKTLLVEDLTKLSKARIIIQDSAKEFPEPISSVVEEMCVDLLRPNLLFNRTLTQQRLYKRMSNDMSISQRIAKGDKIIGIGDIITESHINKLRAMYSAQWKHVIIHVLPGVFLLSLMLVATLFTYLRKYEHSIFFEPRKLIAVIITILLVLTLGNIIIVYGPKEYSGFLVPTALASIIIAIIANVQLSILVTAIIGVCLAILKGIDLSGTVGYLFVVFMGSNAAAIAVSNARHRKHLMVPGLYVSIVNIITIFTLGLLSNISLVRLGMNCLMGTINGITVALLTPGLLPIFEYLSRTTTDMELLELSDLNQPLLTQLKEKASGSYYHSIDVAKLAEAAALSINANPLLARVGSYYHDIGKMMKPEYFIENQKGENLHDNLNPTMSSRIISYHVKDGVKIAKENKLPQVIQDIIQQHHGNTMIGGLRFYQKAMELDKHNAVRIEDFRYPGPKPQTKEAAIILLADSVESARHVLLRDNTSYSRLIGFVREIIEDKAMDAQLDECDLTLRDVNLISDAFVKVLSGIYHTRIEYPKDIQSISMNNEKSISRRTNDWLD